MRRTKEEWTAEIEREVKRLGYIPAHVPDWAIPRGKPLREVDRSRSAGPSYYLPAQDWAQFVGEIGRLSTACAVRIWLAILWEISTRHPGRKWFKLRWPVLDSVGLGGDGTEGRARRRAYQELAKAGLIEVRSQPGRATEIRLRVRTKRARRTSGEMGGH